VVVDPDNPHRVAEARSLALHEEVARRLAASPDVLTNARARVGSWLAEGGVARPYAEAWRDLLAGTTEEVAVAIVDPSERARDLRQCSPFAGVIDPRTRWRILRELGHEAAP